MTCETAKTVLRSMHSAAPTALAQCSGSVGEGSHLRCEDGRRAGGKQMASAGVAGSRENI